MNFNTKQLRYMLGAVAVSGVLLTTAAVYPQVTSAAEETPIEQSVPWRGDRGGKIGGDKSEFLAEALGITVEELEAAQAEALAAGLQQAVDEGLITQAQADQIQERGIGRGGIGHFGRFQSETIDPAALLADALGITVEELDAAQQAAQDAALAQAVEEGVITQEQADQMQARQALQPYLSESAQSAFADAVAQALADGAITQEQADQLLEERANGFERGMKFPGFGGERGGRGHGGMHDGMRGGPDRMPNSTPDSESAPEGSSSGSITLPSSNL